MSVSIFSLLVSAAFANPTTGLTQAATPITQALPLTDACTSCPEHSALEAHMKERARFEDLKVRNEQFLAKTNDESARRKVLSNLLTLGFKIDTEKVYIQAITAKCPACANGG